MVNLSNFKRQIVNRQIVNKMTLYPKLILDALATVRYPGTGKNLVEAGMVEDDIRIEGMKVSFSLLFENFYALLARFSRSSTICPYSLSSL